MNIVIVGGGFAGVRAALKLSKKNIGKVTLISDEPYFLYHATLYSTATGGNKAESVIPLADIFVNSSNVNVVQDKMTSIDQARKLVVGKEKSYKYDKLIIAIGNVTNFYGIEGMAEHAFGVKTLADIKKFSSHIYDEVIANQYLDRNYFVIGGGATGVEMASALIEYLKYLMQIHKNTKGKIRVTLVELEDRILPRLSKTASRIIQSRLEQLGVKVITGHKVESVDGSSINIEGKAIPTETVIWTSGVSNNPFFKKHSHVFHMNEHGKVNVDPYLEASDDIYVLGDNNSMKYSGMVWPATREADFIAKHFSRLDTHASTKRFKPLKPADSIPVGRQWGYSEWHGLYLKGFPGYAVRRFIEYLGYRSILPRHTALTIWRSHYLKDIRHK